MKLFVVIVLSHITVFSFSQQVMPLYSKTIPGSVPASNEEYIDSVRGLAFRVFTPSVSIYLPPKEKANGAAVIICPGGGYGVLVIEKEGHEIARYFAEKGVAAFVLKYRLPDSKIMKDKSTGPLQDAQQAIRLVRHHAEEWHINPDKIGIMGFSAGGHLAATTGTHFNMPVADNHQKDNLRPDFMILVYPVISMTDSLGHTGSRKNLLGENPGSEKIKLFSNELQVTDDTPPAFLIHAGDDKVVDVDNSISFYEALRHHRVPAEIHIYPKGDHGFVLHIPKDEWMSLCMKWMKSGGIIQ
ncbi:MAG: alpha/beta hydrolase [Bacteroidetes bacterium]|nr:alpha/beta hydrolase [Bacteroidota bacterium]